MAAGEVAGPFSLRQMERIEQAAEAANRETGLHFSVFVGDVVPDGGGDIRPMCERLHAGLGQQAARAVLVVVSPTRRKLEIVTGDAARRRVPDRVCALAAMSMTTSFSGGDLVGGIVGGVQMLADSAGSRRR